MAFQFFGKRQAPSSRAARSAVYKGVNVDSSDFDSEMANTMASEGARRLGAAGMQLGKPGAGEGGRVAGVKYAPTPGEAFKNVGKWLGGLGKPRSKK